MATDRRRGNTQKSEFTQKSIKVRKVGNMPKDEKSWKS